MKTNELRIGNKFECMGMIQTVFELCDNTDKGRIKQAGYEYIIMCEENGNQYKPIEIRPIPLTEELILKYGFQKFGAVTFCNDSYKRYVLGRNSMYSIDNISFVYSVNDHDLCELKYLHELQNLYYALTGCELSLSGI